VFIGYARVSTSDQRLDLQREALIRIGCEKVFGSLGIGVGGGHGSCGGLSVIGPQVSITSASAALAEWNP